MWRNRTSRPSRLVLGLWVALVVLGCGGSGQAVARPESPGPLRVDFVAVAQGDATLITSPTGKTVLIDGGPKGMADRLLALVRERTAEPLDLVLLTHRHADHLGGLATVIAAQGARLYMDAPFVHPSPAYAALVRLLEAKKIPVREARRGRSIELGGGARLVLLTPPEPPIAGSHSDVNSNSVVARLEHGQVRILLAADAEAETEAWLLQRSADLKAAALKLAHHGSRHSSTPRFLRAVSPELVIISCGPGNAYDHPHPQTLARLARMGARILRTDEHGTITLWSDGRQISHQPPRADVAEKHP